LRRALDDDVDRFLAWYLCRPLGNIVCWTELVLVAAGDISEQDGSVGVAFVIGIVTFQSVRSSASKSLNQLGLLRWMMLLN